MISSGGKKTCLGSSAPTQQYCVRLSLSHVFHHLRDVGDALHLCESSKKDGERRRGRKALPHPSPNHQRWYAKWKLSRNMYTLHTRFHTFGTDLYSRSVIINEISASELSWKFIKSALLVGIDLSLSLLFPVCHRDGKKHA